MEEIEGVYDSEDFVHPDLLYSSSVTGCTFAYYGERQKLYVAPVDQNHGSMMDEYGEEDIYYRWYSRGAKSPILWGRAGEYRGKFYISFWNKTRIDRGAYRYLDDCLKALEPHIRKAVKQNRGIPVLISTPLTGSFSIDLLDEIRDRTAGRGFKSLLSRDEWEALRKMHQARGAEKKELMKKAGVGFDYRHDPHPWHTAAKKMSYAYGLPNPWGESFEESVDRLLG